MPRDSHIVVTDSGLGGLSICALLEQGLRAAGPARGVRLTYVNAWPFEDRGYNDLPDEHERARVFDLALSRMAQMQPDQILIACNTLSVLYPRTVFSRSPAAPVLGIVDAGVDAFAERLAGEPASSIALIGTKTTIESSEHRARLVERGIDPQRIGVASWHGLAGAIERDVNGPGPAELIGECAARAVAAAPAGRPRVSRCPTTGKPNFVTRSADTFSGAPVSSIIGNVSAVPKPVSTIGWLSTYANGIVTGSVDGSMTPSASAAPLPLALADGAALAVAAAEEAAVEGVLLGDELPVEVELHAARSSAALPRPATSVVRRVDRRRWIVTCFSQRIVESSR